MVYNSVNKHWEKPTFQFRWEQKYFLLTQRKCLSNWVTENSLLSQLSLPSKFHQHSLLLVPLFFFLTLPPQAEGTGTCNFCAKGVLFHPRAAQSRAVVQAKRKVKDKQRPKRRIFWWLWWERNALVQTAIWVTVWQGKEKIQNLRWLEDGVWQEPGRST